MKKLRFIFVFIAMIICCLYAIAGCNSGTDNNGGNIDNNSGMSNNDGIDDNDNGGNNANTDGEQKILVAYFSATNNTETIANYIQSYLNADIYEILAAVPYTTADLNYNSDCRANREQILRLVPKSTAARKISSNTMSFLSVIQFGGDKRRK